MICMWESCNNGTIPGGKKSMLSSDAISRATANSAPPVITARSATPLTSFEPVTEQEISKLLSTSPSKSCCLDPIPTWLLKRISAHIAPIICYLCNLSLSSGTFPPVLKHALVFPRIKKPTLNPEVVNNYRPISNLPYISKLVERVVARRFKSHAEAQGLFPAQQSAYRPFRSTESAIICVHNDLVHAIDDRKATLLVLLDLSAAFDTVDHEILLSILETRFAIQCTALDWLRSYLTGRTQVFVYADKQTVSYPVLCSVPQGSVFGPLGFISYTEDIVNVTEQHKVSSHLYADDTQLYATTEPDDVSSVRRQLGACTADVAQWCASRRLQLNADKTDAVWIASRASLNKVKSQDSSLVMGAETVTPVDVVRNLGV